MKILLKQVAFFVIMSIAIFYVVLLALVCIEKNELVDVLRIVFGGTSQNGTLASGAFLVYMAVLQCMNSRAFSYWCDSKEYLMIRYGNQKKLFGSISSCISIYSFLTISALIGAFGMLYMSTRSMKLEKLELCLVTDVFLRGYCQTYCFSLLQLGYSIRYTKKNAGIIMLCLGVLIKMLSKVGMSQCFFFQNYFTREGYIFSWFCIVVMLLLVHKFVEHKYVNTGELRNENKPHKCHKMY